jgi:hypothetical protein
LTESSLRQKLGNGLLFNLSWLLIVASHSLAIALPVAALHLAIHFAWLGRGHGELSLVCWVSAFGLLLDQLLFTTGLFTLNGQWSLAPLWLGCLWPVLATTLGHAFRGLWDHPALSAVLGAVGGATSYLAGTAMTEIDFGNAVYGPVLVALLWAGLFPGLIYMARTLLQESPGDFKVA